jgi:hypothetical protein
MFNSIIYNSILGFPLIFWAGVIAFILLLTVALIGYLLHHGNNLVKFEWHKFLAILLVIIAILHGAMGILLYTP